MTNASMRTARVRPSPTSFTTETAEVMNVMNTIARSPAAAVTSRPVCRGRRRPRGSCRRSGLVLLDAREQEDLVVHRQAEGHAEHQYRVNTSMKPVAVTSRSHARLPSWNTHTIAPNVAPKLKMFIEHGLERHDHAARANANSHHENVTSANRARA